MKKFFTQILACSFASFVKTRMPSLTVENYIKTIHEVCAKQDGGPASTGQLAAALNVSPGTVTSMLKTLSESNLVAYTPYEGARLTAAGRRLALRVLRRHRLIELFLVRTLNLTWDEVHDEAEHMEHAVSDLLIDRIDATLGHPEVDPHGDPIPRADGSLSDSACHALADCREGDEFRLVRVVDQSAEFLRFLTASGLPLGVEGRVAANHAEAGLVVVHVGGKNIHLGRSAADKLLVQPTS
jgi:DtxR family transcriptional regulator, Mn-dependent transcriptional regulator